MPVDASKDQKPDINRFRRSNPRAPRAGQWMRNRMHQLRSVLQRLRCRRLEAGLFWSGRSQPCLDTGQRRKARQGPRRSRHCDDEWRLHQLSYARKLYRAMPGRNQPDRSHSRTQAPVPSPMAAEGTQVSEVALFALQRLSAKVLAPLVIVHLVVILYAVHGGAERDGNPRPHTGQRVVGRVLRAVRDCGLGSCTDRAAQHRSRMDDVAGT